MALLQKFPIKAIAQNAVALLPERLANPLYYLAQRTVGRLQTVDPIPQLKSCAGILEAAARVRPIEGARLAEVGTGRGLNMPIACWLAGGRSMHTVDLNPLLREERVVADVRVILSRGDEVCELMRRLSPATSVRARLSRLGEAAGSFQAIMGVLDVTYNAPGDARRLPLPDGSIDLYVSSNVFEHIPPADLERILREGYRVLRPGGALVHSIDMSDHFAHTDPKLSPINFLKYSDRVWSLIAGNRLMYQNRLRVDDYEALAKGAVPQADIAIRPSPPDKRSLEVLRAGFPVNARFRRKADAVNATLAATLIVRPPQPATRQATVAPGLVDPLVRS
jgi:hypothetical protein